MSGSYGLMWLMQPVHTRPYTNKALLLSESMLLPLSDFISHSYCVNINLQNGKVRIVGQYCVHRCVVTMWLIHNQQIQQLNAE